MEALLALIESEARRRADEIRADARERASALTAEAGQLARTEAARTRELAKNTIERAQAARLAASRAKFERRKLVAREDLVRRILDRATRVITDESHGAPFASVAARQLELGLAAFDSSVSVRAASPLAEPLANVEPDRVTVSVDQSLDGFVAVAPAGSPELTFGPVELIERFRSELAIEIVRTLEESWDDTGAT